MLKRDLQNAVCDIAGESLWGFQVGMIASSTVLVMILRQFGAGRTMIGSIASIETCAMLFPQVIGLTLFRSRARRKMQLMAYHYVVMIPLLFLVAGVLHFSSHLVPQAARVALLVCWGLFVTSIGVVIAVWMDWVAGIFEVRFRGTVMGLSFFGASGFGAAGGLLSGWVISHGHSANVYAAIYFWAAVIAVGAMTTFWFIDDVGASETDSQLVSISSTFGNFRQSIADENFRAFLIGRIAATSGFCILPLVADYFASREGGAIAPGTLVTCGAAIAVGTALANLGLGRLGDKRGHRIGLLIGIGSQIGALLLLLFVPGQIGCLPVYFALGICSGSAFLSHYNMVFETCPHENRSAHITLANLIIGACTVLTPVFAGVVAEHWGIRIVFKASLALSLLALVWFILRVRDPRDSAIVAVEVAAAG